MSTKKTKVTRRRLSDESKATADVATVGASDATAAVLNELSELGHIDELSDGYRLGITVAVSFGRTPHLTARKGRKTMLSVSGLDPDGAIKAAIREIYPEAADSPYRAAEDLAEQGVEILKTYMEGEDLSFADVMTGLRGANAAEPSIAEVTPATEVVPGEGS
jgi:hypothetical protein